MLIPQYDNDNQPKITPYIQAFFNVSKIKQMGNNLRFKTNYKEICYGLHINLVQIIYSLHTINPKAFVPVLKI